MVKVIFSFNTNLFAASTIFHQISKMLNYQQTAHDCGHQDVTIILVALKVNKQWLQLLLMPDPGIEVYSMSIFSIFGKSTISDHSSRRCQIQLSRSARWVYFDWGNSGKIVKSEWSLEANESSQTCLKLLRLPKWFKHKWTTGIPVMPKEWRNYISSTYSATSFNSFWKVKLSTTKMMPLQVIPNQPYYEQSWMQIVRNLCNKIKKINVQQWLEADLRYTPGSWFVLIEKLWSQPFVTRQVNKFGCLAILKC